MTLSYARLLLFFCTMLPASVVADDAVSLTFCYEDKQLLPYYTGEGDSGAALPGVTIEHLKAAVAQSATPITLRFVRRPWLRCLQQLELNEVDALVATYRKSRQKFAVYPTTEYGELDADRAMSSHASCLVHRFDMDIAQKIARADGKLVVSRPLGHSNPEYPLHIKVLPVHSQHQALQLVVSGRVDATTTLCQVNGVNGADPSVSEHQLILVYPPLYQTTGYLVFSKNFYQQHQAVAQQLWLLLADSIEPQRYYDYLHYPDTPKRDDSRKQP